MRFHCVALLGLIAFANAVLAELPQAAIADTPPVIDTSTSRHLRPHTAFSLNPFSEIITNKKLSKYLKSNQEVDDVSIKLKLNTAGYKLFKNPKFFAWAQYVDAFNKKHQTQHSILATLVRQYGGDDLSIMLEKAKQADKTYGVALRLQGQQMKAWRREGLTTDTLFSIYKLDDGAKNLLENPEAAKTYSNEALSQILIKGKTVSSTEKLASDLQNQQIRHWLDDLQPPENVFKFLALDKGAENVLASPQLQKWLQYAENFHTDNPFTTRATLIDMLTKHYSNSALATMLKSSTATSTYSKRMAAVVEGDLLSRWATAGKPMEYVVKMLGTTPAQTKKLESAYRLKLRAGRSS